MDHDQVLDNAAVAELFGISPSAMRGMRFRGEGPPHFKLGRKPLYRRSVVLEWIIQQEKAERERKAA